MYENDYFRIHLLYNNQKDTLKVRRIASGQAENNINEVYKVNKGHYDEEISGVQRN